MVCQLSKSTTKGLSISSLVVSGLALILGIVAVVARKQGHTPGKTLLWFGLLFYLGAFALILASGFALYGRSVARCAAKKQRKKDDDKTSKLLTSSHHHDHHHDNESPAHIVYTCVALVLFFILLITLCATSTNGCLFVAFLALIFN